MSDMTIENQGPIFCCKCRYQNQKWSATPTFICQ